MAVHDKIYVSPNGHPSVDDSSPWAIVDNDQGHGGHLWHVQAVIILHYFLSHQLGENYLSPINLIIIIQVIYIALFTAASQRLQFTNRKENTSKTRRKKTLLSKKKGLLSVSWMYQCLWSAWWVGIKCSKLMKLQSWIVCQQKQIGIWELQVLMYLVQNGGFDWVCTM